MPFATIEEKKKRERREKRERKRGRKEEGRKEKKKLKLGRVFLTTKGENFMDVFSY